MCKSPLMSMLVFTVLALTSCSSEDGGSPAGLPADGNLQDMATCATEGFKNLGLAMLVNQNVGGFLPHGRPVLHRASNTNPIPHPTTHSCARKKVR